jgi:hypothetical protein
VPKKAGLALDRDWTKPSIALAFLVVAMDLACPSLLSRGLEYLLQRQVRNRSGTYQHHWTKKAGKKEVSEKNWAKQFA